MKAISDNHHKRKLNGNQTKSSLYTHDITPMRVTSGGAHLRDVAPEQHNIIVAMASRWRHCSRFDLAVIRTPDLPHQ